MIRVKKFLVISFRFVILSVKFLKKLESVTSNDAYLKELCYHNSTVRTVKNSFFNIPLKNNNTLRVTIALQKKPQIRLGKRTHALLCFANLIVGLNIKHYAKIVMIIVRKKMYTNKFLVFSASDSCTIDCNMVWKNTNVFDRSSMIVDNRSLFACNYTFDHTRV